MYDAITDIMSNGRTSRMFRSMVRDQQTAAAAAGFSGFPGTKYAHLFAFYGVPVPGHTNADMQKGIQEQITKLKTEDVTDEELQMFKTRTKADLIRGLASNTGLAQQLAVYQTRYGDWRELFRLSRQGRQGHEGRHQARSQQGFPGQQPHCRNH